MNFGIPGGVARRKDIMMKPDTHEGQREREMSAKCEHSVKAQQEGMPASTWGRHGKVDKEETETQWAFVSPVPQ